MAKGKYESARKSFNLLGLLAGILALAVLLLLMISLKACAPGSVPGPEQTSSTASTHRPTEAPTTVPTEPPTTAPYIESTASIGVTGDVMGHGPFLKSCLSSDGTYDFTGVYSYIKPYFEDFDFMVANLEVTLGGTAAGAYKGYPTFNSPDAMATALKDAGVDMALTANNHSYDTGHNGFMRTQTTLTEIGLPYIGTRTDESLPEYTVQDINGIKVGMVCYTYESGEAGTNNKALNGLRLSAADSRLISSFNYDDLDGFYESVAVTLDAMRSDGADATMVFIHWGNEYQLSPNDNQTAIAQELCDLGVDVIVGGHPHVVQPMALLTGENGNTTYCLYSAGNCISNQRRSEISKRPDGYTEDGVVFGITLQKWNDGTVEFCDINILPTWVDMKTVNGKKTYTIIPLDPAMEAWDSYDVSTVAETYLSYNRTMSVLGEGLNACRESLSLPPVPLLAEE